MQKIKPKPLSLLSILSTLLIFILSLTPSYAKSVSSIAVFGDSLSDNGNTTHLLNALRNDDNPAFLVAPLEKYLLNKIDDYTEDSYIPESWIEAAKSQIQYFLEEEVGTRLVDLANRVASVPTIPPKPYWRGHFSNGRVWDENLAKSMGLDLQDESQYLNRAFGGSWAVTYDHKFTLWRLIRHPIDSINELINGKLVPPSLGLVVEAYLMERRYQANPNTLYFVFSGGNDYINALHYEDNYNESVMDDYVANIINSINKASQKLLSSGAKHLVLVAMPDVGASPRFNKRADYYILSDAVRLHNKRLLDLKDELSEAYPKASITYIDTASMLNDAIENPAKYDLENVTDACTNIVLDNTMYSLKPIEGHPFANNAVLEYVQQYAYRDQSFIADETNFTVCNNPDKYLFWDIIHPTAKVHRVLSEKICKILQDSGYEISCQA